MNKENKRRNFLKGVGLGSVVLGSAPFAIGSTQEEKLDKEEKKKPHYSMLFDQTKCVGCGECEDACHKVNFVPYGQDRMVVQDRTDPLNVKERRFVRMSCQQCEDAPCVNVCPTNACHRDPLTDIVTMNGDDCIGCAYCIVACPYDVRFINEETNMAENCNFCLDTRLEKGLLPACIEACKYEAIVFGDLNDKNSRISKLLSVKDSVRQKPEMGTKPSLRYIPAIKQGV